MPAEQQDVLDAVAELCGALDRCEAELLTARERHEEFKHVAMKEAELAQEERDSHAKAASEAMAREKALREALEEARQYVCDWPIGLDTDPQEQRGGARDTMIANIDFALAGSPSEKPGSEDTCEACEHPWASHTSGGMCIGHPPHGSECYCVLFPPSSDAD